MCGTPSTLNSFLGLRFNRRQGWKPRLQRVFALTIRRCSCCGLTYPDPLSVPGSLADHYSVPPETYWTDDYFSLDENHFIREISRAKDLVVQALFVDGFSLKLSMFGLRLARP